MAVTATQRAMRPFWIHQLAEYVIGLLLLAQGLQAPDPLLPSLAGGLIIVNAAITKGPLSAFRTIGRRLHRVLDVVVIALVVAAAAQPWIDADIASRMIMVAITVVLGFVWFYTDFAERPARAERRAASAGDRGEAIGRSAGRFAGSALNEWRRRRG